MRRLLLLVMGACGGLELVPNPDGGDAAVIHGELCTQSSCSSLVTTVATFGIGEGEQIQLPGIAVGGGYVYTSTPSHLVRAPEHGGPVEVVTPSNLTYAIVADESNVYWSTIGTNGVFMRAHAGGDTIALPSSLSIDREVFVDRTNVYWCEDGGLASVPIAGGAPTSYAASARNAGLRGDRFYFSSCASTMDVGDAGANAGYGYGVTADDIACYWIANGVGGSGPSGHDSLFMKPLDGGTSVEVVAGPTTESSLDGHRMIADGDAVYFRSLDGSFFAQLSRVPRGGGSLTHVTDDVVIAYTITNDAVFWIAVDNQVSIKRMPKWH